MAGASAARTLDLGLERQQRAQLRIAVLLTTKMTTVRVENRSTSSVNGKARTPHVVHPHAARAQQVMASRIRPSQLPTDTITSSLSAVASMIARGHEFLRRGPFYEQPVEEQLIVGRILGVHAKLGVSRAAREIGCLRMHPRQSAISDAVAVLVQVAIEFLELLVSALSSILPRSGR